MSEIEEVLAAHSRSYRQGRRDALVEVEAALIAEGATQRAITIVRDILQKDGNRPPGDSRHWSDGTPVDPAEMEATSRDD